MDSWCFLPVWALLVFFGIRPSWRSAFWAAEGARPWPSSTRASAPRVLISSSTDVRESFSEEGSLLCCRVACAVPRLVDAMGLPVLEAVVVVDEVSLSVLEDVVTVDIADLPAAVLCDLWPLLVPGSSDWTSLASERNHIIFYVKILFFKSSIRMKLKG